MSKLKPCPFCGSKARIAVSGETQNYQSFYVFCRNIKTCGCKFEFFDTEAEAVAAWNKRTPDIVRCGECKLCAVPTVSRDKPVCIRHDCLVEYNYFCHWGERKEV